MTNTSDNARAGEKAKPITQQTPIEEIIDCACRIRQIIDTEPVIQHRAFWLETIACHAGVIRDNAKLVSERLNRALEENERLKADLDNATSGRWSQWELDKAKIDEDLT